jgi:uncharacterized protein (DUF4415 family)
MRRIKRNSPAEEAAIQRGIAADPDAAEWTEEDFAQAHCAADVLPAEMLASLTPRRRGPGTRPVKAQVTFRLDQDVLTALRASGPGWQTRANNVLRKMVKG